MDKDLYQCQESALYKLYGELWPVYVYIEQDSFIYKLKSKTLVVLQSHHLGYS